jgi:hypothetical protein
MRSCAATPRWHANSRPSPNHHKLPLLLVRCHMPAQVGFHNKKLCSAEWHVKSRPFRYHHRIPLLLMCAHMPVGVRCHMLLQGFFDEELRRYTKVARRQQASPPPSQLLRVSAFDFVLPCRCRQEQTSRLRLL